MRSHLEPLSATVFLGVMICWFVFAGVFLFRKKPPQVAESKRDRASLFGIGLQGLGYAWFGQCDASGSRRLHLLRSRSSWHSRRQRWL